MGLPVALIAALVLGCSGGGGAPPGREAAPMPDRGAPCVDVGDVRACWRPGPSWSPRRVPAGAAPAAGWRCHGMGEQRQCVDRAANAGPFVCEGARCTQRYPRMPDDGVWECIDLDGAVICQGGRPAAGVTPGPADPGWTCGAHAGKPGERVCVDLAPDLPGGQARGWRCRFEHTRGERRTCVRDERAPGLARACGDGQPACPDSAACEHGRCLPPRPAPGCWFDPDCAAGQRCRLGTCG